MLLLLRLALSLLLCVLPHPTPSHLMGGFVHYKHYSQDFIFSFVRRHSFTHNDKKCGFSFLRKHHASVEINLFLNHEKCCFGVSLFLLPLLLLFSSLLLACWDCVCLFVCFFFSNHPMMSQLLAFAPAARLSHKPYSKMASILIFFSLHLYLVLINRTGGLYGRILTEVASTDRT